MKKFLNNIEDILCVIIILSGTIMTSVNVFARYVFKSSMPFVEELTCLGLVILSFWGAAVAAKKGAHLGLGVVTDMLPDSITKWLDVFADVLGMIFAFITLYYGILSTMQTYRLKMLTAGMQWPEWLFSISIPIGGAILFVRFLQMAIIKVRTKGGSIE